MTPPKTDEVEEMEHTTNEILLTLEILSEVISEHLWYVDPKTLRKIITQTLSSLHQAEEERITELDQDTPKE